MIISSPVKIGVKGVTQKIEIHLNGCQVSSASCKLQYLIEIFLDLPSKLKDNLPQVISFNFYPLNNDQNNSARNGRKDKSSNINNGGLCYG